ncbi:MAG: hypothetical protein JWP32_2873 [Schumannella sp.]|nr:hypothetical protein [Schumannella sp.]
MAGVEAGTHLEGKVDALTRVQAELARIEKLQVKSPQCWLCGQRTNTPDKFGLCSKITASHQKERQTGGAT